MTYLAQLHTILIGVAILAFACVGRASSSPLECRPVAFVRAPDLHPNTVIDGEARLVMHGEGCHDLAKWEVGLRLQERAIFKFWAEGATFPTSRPKFVPERDPSLCDDDDSATWAHTPPILDHLGFLRRRACLTAEQIEYYRALANRTLWNIQAVERVAFDSRTELDLNQEASTLWEGDAFYAVRNFSVHIPNTNFPPQSDGARLWGDLGDDAQGEASFTETMFEYYFALTYKDGSQTEVPAGRAAFIPTITDNLSEVPFGSSPTTSTKKYTKTVIAESKFVENDFMEQRGEFVGTPACDAGRSSNLSVEMTVPAQGVHTGRTIPISIKISHNGNSTAYVSKVLLTLRTCTSDTWALAQAQTPNQRKEADGCNGNPTTRHSWVSTGAAEQMAWIQEGDILRQTTDMEPLCSGKSVWDSYDEGKRQLAARYRSVTISHRNASHTEYNPLDIDIVIPTHMIPPFNTSFFSYGHVLDLRLETLYECDAPNLPASSALASLRHLKLDDEWTRWTMHAPTEGRNRRILYATAPIQLEANVTGQNQPLHYTNPAADAIYLSSSASPSRQWPKVNVTLQNQTQDSELATDRYNLWQRLEGDGFSRGTAFELVSDIWQKKECVEWERSIGGDAAGHDHKLEKSVEQVVFGS